VLRVLRVLEVLKVLQVLQVLRVLRVLRVTGAILRLHNFSNRGGSVETKVGQR